MPVYVKMISEEHRNLFLECNQIGEKGFFSHFTRELNQPILANCGHCRCDFVASAVEFVYLGEEQSQPSGVITHCPYCSSRIALYPDWNAIQDAPPPPQRFNWLKLILVLALALAVISVVYSVFLKPRSTPANELGVDDTVAEKTVAEDTVAEDTVTEKLGVDDTVAEEPVSNEPDPVDHYYELFIDDVTWVEAKKACEQKGGHLVTITSYSEYYTVVDLIESKMATLGDTPGKTGLYYVWLGAENPACGAKENDFRWVTGEDWGELDCWWYLQNNDGSRTYEPSFQDQIGDNVILESYLCLWAAKYDEQGWTLNDQRNDLSKFVEPGRGVGYICEYGD